MLGIRGRDLSIRVLRPFAIFLIWARVSAATVTLIGLGLIIFGAVLLAAGEIQAGAIVIGGGAILDSVDGIIARETGTVSRSNGSGPSRTAQHNRQYAWFVRGTQPARM